MELAINFSHPAAELVLEGKIRVDRFKAPDWPELIAEAEKNLPVYVHFAINAGAGDSRTTDWQVAEEIARRTKTPFVNLHLAPRARDYAAGDIRGVVERLVVDVERAAGFFGRERVIVENIPLGNAEENFSPAAGMPEVMHEVVERTRCGFLLDLSHARLTARHLGVDERQYISALPVRKIRELHLTGLAVVNGRLRDHMPMSDEDWRMARWAVDQIRRGEWSTPTIVAFEYGGVGGTFEWRTDRAVIAEQVPRLNEIVRD